MYIYMTVAVLSFVAHIVASEGTKEPPKDLKLAKTTLKSTVLGVSTSESPSQAALHHGSLWDKPQTSYLNTQQETWGNNIKRYETLLKAPHSLTKLAKTLSLGFDPSFSKDYFEPFERRPRPVTLVAFRKKGYVPRHTVKQLSSRSSEVAEKQSPYNDVSNFWQNTEMEA